MSLLGRYQRYQERKEERQLGELGQQYLGGDASVLPQIGGVDPARAVQLQQLQAYQTKQQQQDLTRASQLAKTIIEADPEQRPEVYRATMEVAKKYGIDVSELPEFYSPEADKYLNDVIRVSEGLAGDQRIFGKTPEGYVVDPKTEEARRFKGLPKTTPEAQEKIFARTTTMRKEHTKESGQFIKTRDAYNKIEASFKDPSPAGDMAGIFSYMKLLDPGSTVREGEYATVEKAGSVPNWVRSAYNKTTKGDLLTPKMRKDFSNRSKKLYNTQLTTQKRRDKQYRGLAKQTGLDPKQVVLDLYDEKAPPSSINNDPLGIR